MATHRKSIVKETIDRLEEKMAIGESRYAAKQEIWSSPYFGEDPNIKEFLDWKAATNRAPATLKAYCSRLSWYYNFSSATQFECDRSYTNRSH